MICKAAHPRASPHWAARWEVGTGHALAGARAILTPDAHPRGLGGGGCAVSLSRAECLDGCRCVALRDPSPVLPRAGPHFQAWRFFRSHMHTQLALVGSRRYAVWVGFVVRCRQCCSRPPQRRVVTYTAGAVRAVGVPAARGAVCVSPRTTPLCVPLRLGVLRIHARHVFHIRLADSRQCAMAHSRRTPTPHVATPHPHPYPHTLGARYPPAISA